MACLEPGVGIGNDQLHPTQAARLERAQERCPERAVLAVPDGEPEHLAPPVGADPGGDHHGLGHHPVIDPGLAVSGVEEHIRELLLGQRSVAERAHLDVEIGADPRDLALGDPGVGAEGLDQVVDLAGRHAVQIGLHHHREQRLVDPAAAFEQRGEERPGTQLRDPQLQIPRRGGQDAGAVPVALVAAFRGTLVTAGADRVGELGLDQRLIHRLRGLADTITDIGGLECIEDFEQGRLVQGHRVAPLYEILGRFTQRLTRWPLQHAQARRTGPGVTPPAGT